MKSMSFAWACGLCALAVAGNPSAHAQELACDPADASPSQWLPAAGDATATGATWHEVHDVGGGRQYHSAVARTDPRVIARVSSVDGLLGALSQAQRGDIVYIEDCAVLDLTGHARLVVPEGVTLASGRGTSGSPGGELRSRDVTHRPDQLLTVLVASTDSRITGLRLRGPDPFIGDNRDDPNSRGIRVEGTNVEIDNCELTGFSHAAVRVMGGKGAHVHHSHIHHNRRTGLGYGVVVEGDWAYADIDHNLFHDNRHDIAGSGTRTQRYSASDNVSTRADDHHFDMHGERENGTPSTACAGWLVHVHHNTLFNTHNEGVKVRGVPAWTALIEWNHFASSIDEAEHPAVRQSTYTGNLTVKNNAYDYRGYLYVTGGKSGQTTCGEAPSWEGPAVASYEAKSWLPLLRGDIPVSQLGVGDFDDDGVSDLLWTDGAAWRISSGARKPFSYRATSRQLAQNLGFGDFDGDGSTDVFYADGASWWLSRGASAEWQKLRDETLRISQLRFADFNDDGKTDVFWIEGNQWYVSWGGTSDKAKLQTSGAQLSELRFADFDGNGKADVFRADGTYWKVSWDGRSTWQILNRSDERVESLAFGDFDGDGADDVFTTSGTEWSVAWRGQSELERFVVSQVDLAALRFGDFDGDHKLDALRLGSP